MRAVAHLVRTYFWATPLTRGLLGVGLVCVAVGTMAYTRVPFWTLGNGMSHRPLWYQTVLLFLPWLGLMLSFFSSASMPVIVEKLALGRLIRVAPRGRVQLLLSVLLTTVLLALLSAVAATVAFLGYPIDIRPERVFTRTLIVTFADFGLLYAALWVVGKTRGLWLLMGSLLIIVGVTLPLAYIALPTGFPPLVWAGLAGWVAFALVLLLGARLKHVLDGSRRRIARLARALLPVARYTEGAEADVLLGTTRPWVLALGQVVPIGAAAVLVPGGGVWLFCLALFSAISGAITSTAAARSRRLWLRFDWTRAELFRRVEIAYWRYNAYSLSVLLLFFVALGSYLELSTRLLALGLPLLVLGGLVSHYLGLMITRSLGWLESCLAIGTTLLLMATAVVAADNDTGAVVAIELEIALAALALVYRGVAKSRWNALDWMLCRGEAVG